MSKHETGDTKIKETLSSGNCCAIEKQNIIDEKSAAENLTSKMNGPTPIKHVNGKPIKRKGSLTSDCSSSTEIDTPKHVIKFCSSLNR